MCMSTLLNTIKKEGSIGSDRRLAQILGIAPSQISKLRTGAPLTGDTMIRIYDEIGMSIERIRALAAA